MKKSEARTEKEEVLVCEFPIEDCPATARGTVREPKF